MQTKKWKTRAAVLCLCVGIASACSAKVIYVDADATGANDGTSWADAYFYLQDALMFAAAGDEIRVAQGTYRPDDFALSDRPNLGRDETFQLINGVTLKGGYAGLGEPDPNTRSVELYATVLILQRYLRCNNAPNVYGQLRLSPLGYQQATPLQCPPTGSFCW